MAAGPEQWSSLGMAQMRGNGVLVLTDDELFFQMWAPKRELNISIGNITAVETPRTFLGKTKFKALLKIVFKDEKNQSDSAAWLVGNLSDWKTSIEKIIKSDA